MFEVVIAERSLVSSFADVKINAQNGQQGTLIMSPTPAGNHALGLAYHGKLLNIPVTVIMPETAPLTKVCSLHGSLIHLHIRCQKPKPLTAQSNLNRSRSARS